MNGVENFRNIYYVILTCIEEKSLLADECDKRFLLNMLRDVRDEKKLDIYAYCVMDNEIYLMLRISEFSIEEVMKELVEKYENYFKMSKGMNENVFKKPYYQELPDSREDVMRCCCGIHYIPVQEGMAKSVDTYWWSSYTEYRKENIERVIERDFLLFTFTDHRKKALRQFLQYHKDFGAQL